MRNLKKILALVLALTMVLGLSISASAGTFTDVNEDDDYAAAIELLASLDVLAGMGDGTYNAAGSYTREQFTKILYVLVTGKDDGAAMYTEVAPFPDVAADRWSAGYINWAVQLGILVGRDDGLFHPTDVVNYAEACKMFLIAMGYSASMYTYPYGFIDKADSLKLFDDINGYATYAAANRGTVAQMAYNALFAEAPRFGTYVAKEGETSKTETKLLIMGAFGVTKGLGTLVGTSTDAYDSAVYADGQVDLMFEVYDEDAKIWVPHNDVFEYAEDVDDLIGMQVFVWSKEDENAFNDTKVYLIEDARKDKAYIVNPYDVIEIDDTTAGRVSFKDGEATRRIKIDANTRGIDWEGKPWGALDVKANWEADKDVLYRAIDTGNDGDFDAVYVIKPDFARITALSDDKVSLSAGHLVGSNDIMEDDDVVIALEDGLKKDDYVLVFPRKAVIGNSVDDAFAVIKAPVVEAVKLTKQSDEYDYYADVAYRYAYAENNVDLGKTYNLYLNANGFIAKAVEIEDEADGNYILVTAVYNNITNVDGTNPKLFGASVAGYLADGTKKTFSIDIDEVTEIYDADGKPLYINKESKDWAKFAVNEGWQPAAEKEYAIYCYGLNDDGVIDDLEFVAGEVNDLDEVHNAKLGKANGLRVKYNETSTLLSAAAGNIGFITSGTVIYNVDNDGDVSVLSADDMVAFDSITENDKHVYTQAGVDGGNVKVVLIYEAIKKTSDKYGLIISGIKNDVSSTKANYTLKVAVDGEIVELTTKNVTKGSEKYPLDDTLKTKSGDEVIGYARITLNASGKIDSLDLLADNTMADVTEDGDAVLVTQHAVTAIPNSKGVAVRNTKINHDPVNGDCVLIGLENSALEEVLEYDSDVAFYTIGMDPCGKVTNTKKIAAATADALMKSDLTTDVDNHINSDDTVYAIDAIMMRDDDDMVVKAVFIYTTPVSGPEDEDHGNEFVPEETLDPADGVDLNYTDAEGNKKPVEIAKPAVNEATNTITLSITTAAKPPVNTAIQIPLVDLFGEGYDFYTNAPARGLDGLVKITHVTAKWNGTTWVITPELIYVALHGETELMKDTAYSFKVKVEDQDPGLTVPTELTAENVTLAKYADDGKFPAVTVKVGETTLTAGTDYDVVWTPDKITESTEEVKYTAKVTGKGNYTGEISKSFTVKGTTGGETVVDPGDTVLAKPGTKYKFYKYGGTALTEDEAKNALGAAVAETIGIPVDSITAVEINAATAKATVKWGASSSKEVDLVTETPIDDNNGTIADPIPLFAVAYKGTTLKYVEAAGGTVEGFPVNGFVIDESIKVDTSSTKGLPVNAAGKATVPGGLTKDINYVDAVALGNSSANVDVMYEDSTAALGYTALAGGAHIQASLALKIQDKDAIANGLTANLVATYGSPATSDILKSTTGDGSKLVFDIKAGDVPCDATNPATLDVKATYAVAIDGNGVEYTSAAGTATIKGLTKGDTYLPVQYVAGKPVYSAAAANVLTVNPNGELALLEATYFAPAYTAPDGKVHLVSADKVTFANVGDAADFTTATLKVTGEADAPLTPGNTADTVVYVKSGSSIELTAAVKGNWLAAKGKDGKVTYFAKAGDVTATAKGTIVVDGDITLSDVKPITTLTIAVKNFKADGTNVFTDVTFEAVNVAVLDDNVTWKNANGDPADKTAKITDQVIASAVLSKVIADDGFVITEKTELDVDLSDGSNTADLVSKELKITDGVCEITIKLQERA